MVGQEIAAPGRRHDCARSRAEPAGSATTHRAGQRPAPARRLGPAPLAPQLETALHSGTAALGQSIFTIGIPEELAKAVPVLVVGLIYRRRHGLMPRDYLFLGAVSGLVFGASEVVHYFTVNGIDQFFQTVKSAIPAIEQMLSSGQSASTSVFEVLIGPVLYFILNFAWRFVTDPVTHAC